MNKFYIVLSFFVILISQNLLAQDEWKTAWSEKLSVLDSLFRREQAQFRLMQSHQNESDESLILAGIDSLNVFVPVVNAAIDMCNAFEFPNTPDGQNGAETFRLKIAGVKEYFEQCRMQTQVNNNILQKKLKNESLQFKVSQIDELKLKDYTPLIKY